VIVAIPQIQVYDDDRKRIGVVDNAESFTWARKWREIDEWTLTINAELSNADLLVEDGYIGYYQLGQYRLGMIEFPALATGKTKADNMWEFKGRSIKQALANRILQNFIELETEFDTQTAVTREAAMRHYVDVEAISATNTDRAIPNLSLEADAGRGGTLEEYKGRLQVLSDVITELCIAGDPTPLGWDVLFTPATAPPTDPGTLTFQIKTPRDKTTVKFSGQFQTINGSKYEHDLRDYRNAALVGGSGAGTDRIFRDVTDGTDVTGLKRKEIFFDETSYTTNDELDQQGATRLLEYAGVESVTAEYNPRGSFRYITDFDLGDIVKVTVGKFAAMTTTITEIEENYTRGEGEKVTLTFGTKKPDMIDLMIRDRKQYLQTIRR
jgi:hypothetical protein